MFRRELCGSERNSGVLQRYYQENTIKERKATRYLLSQPHTTLQ